MEKVYCHYFVKLLESLPPPPEALKTAANHAKYYDVHNLYKSLSEVKSEVEMVIKTGRQIVQKKQTENPKELDERITALKLHYNELGAKVTERKQQLEKCLKLSRKMRKEMNALTEWLAATDMELTKRSAVEGMPSNLDSEVAWAKSLKQQQHTQHLAYGGPSLQAVCRGRGPVTQFTIMAGGDELVGDRLFRVLIGSGQHAVFVDARAGQGLGQIIEDAVLGACCDQWQSHHPEQ
ncbi:hypothetical protein QTO34_000803 [Cnephaeus nilssonii]|uniref:Uncharacterized protein n=1 Tax=Cnephaeus nilssonii TaxID=3371016 RepID=A0AA40IC92_CNENI|nr:hypothetical protein QTO34_000803 [Eptesicus nilssonii]